MSNMRSKEYKEWHKLKFQVEVNKGQFIFRSVDYGALPIHLSVPSSLGIMRAKRELLKEINKYNKVNRWNSKNVGDKRGLVKVTVVKNKTKKTYYRFKSNSYSDIELIGEQEIIKNEV